MTLAILIAVLLTLPTTTEEPGGKKKGCKNCPYSAAQARAEKEYDALARQRGNMAGDRKLKPARKSSRRIGLIDRNWKKRANNYPLKKNRKRLDRCPKF